MEVRARRRCEELRASGDPNADYEETLRDQKQRDEADSQREIAPLRAADDAITVDSSQLSLDQVIGSMRGAIADRYPDAL